MIYTDGVHLISDDPPEYPELHEFARKLGLRRQWFQGDHYDITTRAKAALAMIKGATLIDPTDIVLVMRRSEIARGLREGNIITNTLPADWAPVALDPFLAADRNTKLLRIYAPGRRIGRRGGDHLDPVAPAYPAAFEQDLWRGRDYLPMARPLSPEEGAGWLAEFRELPGCTGTGDTQQAAINDAAVAAEEWIATARAEGRDVPPPRDYEAAP